jgi:hypothetical protein
MKDGTMTAEGIETNVGTANDETGTQTTAELGTGMIELNGTLLGKFSHEIMMALGSEAITI